MVERYGAIRYSLAGPLKELAKATLDFTDDQLYGSQASKEAVDSRYGFSPRWFLQRLGTEGGRKTFGEGFWTERCLEKILKENPDIAVIDDVRFCSESVAIRSRLGTIWRLESPDRETTADQTHASESDWLRAEYDFLIKPLVRGIPQLKQLVDDVCHKAGLRVKMRELPL